MSSSGAAGFTPPEVQMQHDLGLWPPIAGQTLLDHRHMLLVEVDKLLRTLLTVEHLTQQSNAGYGVMQQVDP
ncbi:hypothetical protein D3C76_1515120 [compost metagenome]